MAVDQAQIWTPEWATSRGLLRVQCPPGSGETFAAMQVAAMQALKPIIDHATIAATGMGKAELYGTLVKVKRSDLSNSTFCHELAHHLLETPSSQPDDDLANRWCDLDERLTVRTLDDSRSSVFFRLLPPGEGSSTSRRFEALSAAEAWQDLLQRMVVWARRVAPWRLWHYLLIALTRRSNAISWSASPPGQSATSSRRAPRGPNRTQMTTDPVICGESLSYAYS